MAGLRFFFAGLLLFAYLIYVGYQWPTKREWQSASVVGILLLTVGNGAVTYAEQNVSSSLAALSMTTAPVWMAVFASFWGHKIAKLEWLGIMMGALGVVLLNLGGSLRGSPMDACLLIAAAASWSFGSVWAKHLVMPKGLMASATQMIMGGLALLVLSYVWGETWPQVITMKSWMALAFLLIFGSIVAYSAYLYLLHRVRPIVASSNTFVNPVVAFVLGVSLGGESITALECAALVVIVIAVFLILSQLSSQAKKT